MSDHSSSPSRAQTPVSTLPEHIHTARPYRFNWDPSSRKPGPESVSGTTEGREGDYFSAEPRLNLNTPTTLPLGALPLEWSSAKHGFHGMLSI
jgi:vacuolar protein sorting-associated protein 54